MLKEIKIKNFAIIDNIEIKFSKNLNIITGETGSGKSIIVNAIDLLLGGKFSKESFRNSDSIEIIGKFEFSNQTIEIKKIFNISGKHKVYFDGFEITNQELKDKTKNFIDMHGQHSQHSILNKINHIDFLDNFGDYNDLLVKLKNYFFKNQEYTNNLDDLLIKSKELSDKKDLYNYQSDELNRMKLYKGIDDDITKEYNLLSNVKEIHSSIDSLIDLIDQKEESLKNNAIRSVKILDKLSNLDEYFNETAKLFNDIKINFDEVCYDLNAKKNEYTIDQERLTIVDELLQKIEEVKRKYGGTIDSAIEYKNQIDNYLKTYINTDDQIVELQGKIKKNNDFSTALSKKISDNRKKNIPNFEKYINKILTSLNMDGAELSVNMQNSTLPHPKGIDDCEFYIMTNKGSVMKPVVKIASGGETSRLMLAIKILMQDKIKKNTLVFDEIDLGVSGKAAENIGNNLVKLSNNTQIICISHLPQIASKGFCHHKIFKSSANNQVVSNVVKLNSNERVHEIAGMLSGNKLTDSSINQAKYLLGSSDG